MTSKARQRDSDAAPRIAVSLIDRGSLGGCVAIVGASIILGLLHNAANPAGLRSPSDSVGRGAAATTVPARRPDDRHPARTWERAGPERPPAPLVASPPADEPGVYQHRMIKVDVTGAALTARSPSQRYSNETIAVRRQPVRTPAAAPGMPGVRDATWDEVAEDLNTGHAVLVDSRPTKAFELGHVGGAVSLPFTRLSEHLPRFKEAHPPGTPIVIYCSNLRCSLTRALASELAVRHGYDDIRCIPGGYLEWRRGNHGRSGGG